MDELKRLTVKIVGDEGIESLKIVDRVMAQPPKAKAIERLKKALDAISDLRTLQSGSPEFMKWRESTLGAISRTFGDNSDHIKGFKSINFSPPKPFYPAAYAHGLNSASAKIESMIEAIKEDWENDNETQIPSSAQGNERPRTNEVFVIHGRDEGARELVARFLEKRGLKPVILHEQPNEGRTIIEKIEAHTQVSFAVVLLTPDDVGSLKEEKHDLTPRARQNVIFEFGYFIGKLGRERVCALVKGDVEKPSDFDGVLYIPLDESGGWNNKLIRELKTAGIQVDANLVF